MNDLKIANSNNLKPQYKKMLKNISNKMPVINKANQAFFKSSSQFMNVTVDINEVSPIRSMKHVLAVIEKTRYAIQESEFAQQKIRIKLEKKKDKAHNLISSDNPCPHDIELLDLAILKDKVGIVNQENYTHAAIRKLNSLVNQYHNLMKFHGIDNLTEELYEEHETKHHIMTVFKQALIVCRSKGGVIDEGNQIYFFDLGINGLVAQAEVDMYLNYERKVIEEGGVPTHKMQMDWLNSCVEKYSKMPGDYIASRGFNKLDYESLYNEQCKNM